MEHVLDTASIHQNRDEAPSPRRYNSTLRRAHAQQTRQAVLEAGRALFTGRGYARTTMREIAAQAGIAVETVYQHFRSKPAVLKALLDLAVGGDEEPIPVARREWVAQVVAEPHPRGKIARFAEAITAVHADLAPLFIAARAAAEADKHVAEIWSERKAERLRGMSDFARQLIDNGALRPGADAEDTRDKLFTLASPEVYGLLVLELGWPPHRYTTWLTHTLIQQLLLA